MEFTPWGEERLCVCVCVCVTLHPGQNLPLMAQKEELVIVCVIVYVIIF